MAVQHFPVIDPVATGQNILRLRTERGLSLRDMQQWFNFEEPRAIYKWQSGKTLPTVDNLYALSALLGVSMNDILVEVNRTPFIGSQVYACEPALFLALKIKLAAQAWAFLPIQKDLSVHAEKCPFTQKLLNSWE